MFWTLRWWEWEKLLGTQACLEWNGIVVDVLECRLWDGVTIFWEWERLVDGLASTAKG